ncbi:MAG: sigma-70 family RNA polymerase sigma factor [Muribaculaceae bacterium]|nr:sigma-70 family RNA polymerase sigma factor [Muribaculaceae bacterium]
MEKTIERLCQQHYEAHKQAFINFIHARFPFNGDEIVDLYNDIWMDVIDNIRRGKTEMVKNWKSYIFGIGLRRACKMTARGVAMESIDTDDRMAADYDSACLDTLEEDLIHIKHLEKIETLMEELYRMPEKHRALLEYFYLEGMSTEEIAVAMGYSGQRSVITMKRRSVAMLRDRLMPVA